MSLLMREERRAYFAGLAMQSLLNRADLCDLDRVDLAQDAWRMADAMIFEEDSRDDPDPGLENPGRVERGWNPAPPTEGLKRALKRMG